jgi:ComF family protein
MTKSLLQKKIRQIADGILDLAWPRLCPLCGRPLLQKEEILCLNCLYELPKTDQLSFTDNKAAERFWGKISFEKVGTGYHYLKESKVQKAIESIKYKGEKELGEYLAREVGYRIKPIGFFENIDYIIPVPLHPLRQRKRGYNQSEWIARGLSKASGIPLDTKHLHRSICNTTQTTRNLWDRWQNVQALFGLHQAEELIGKHVLVADDVLTSGSTLEACGQVLQTVPEIQISFFALALA